MGRTIKLLLYFFAYQLAFMGVAICGYMLYQGSYEVPQTPDSLYTNLTKTGFVSGKYILPVPKAGN